jgi:hypothetical protein
VLIVISLFLVFASSRSIEHESETTKIDNDEGQELPTDKQVKYRVIEDPLRFVRDKGKP